MSLHTIISATGHPTRALSKEEGIVVGGEVTVVISGLTPGVSYNVYTCIENEAGKGPRSPQRIFTTGEYRGVVSIIWDN